MAYEITKVTHSDLGRIGYMILKWDAELPKHLRMLNGDAAFAERSAGLVVSNPDLHGYKLVVDKELAGGYCLHATTGIFSPKRFGQLLMWYVEPKYRGGLHGLRLLRHATQLARDIGLAWIEVNPWADAAGAHYVLHKLGYIEAVHTFIMRTD